MCLLCMTGRGLEGLLGVLEELGMLLDELKVLLDELLGELKYGSGQLGEESVGKDGSLGKGRSKTSQMRVTTLVLFLNRSR